MTSDFKNSFTRRSAPKASNSQADADSSVPTCDHVHHNAGSLIQTPSSTNCSSRTGAVIEALLVAIWSSLYLTQPCTSLKHLLASEPARNRLSQGAIGMKSTTSKQVLPSKVRSNCAVSLKRTWLMRFVKHSSSISSLLSDRESVSNTGTSLGVNARLLSIRSRTCFSTRTAILGRTFAWLSHLRRTSSFTVVSCVNIRHCINLADNDDMMVLKKTRPKMRHAMLKMRSTELRGTTCIEPGVICVMDQ
mmetsp:Transcript_6129/g.14645  ORF Transcript_6129/g.14645 Transcript_6129/m.14645 type:complete len:248 (-) Transcript_6129:1646-2389(-)